MHLPMRLLRSQNVVEHISLDYIEFGEKLVQEHKVPLDLEDDLGCPLLSEHDTLKP